MRTRERLAAAALFAAVAAAYLLSPYRHLLDPRYALLTSEVLLRTGSWDVAPFLRTAERPGARAPRSARAPGAAAARPADAGPHYQLRRRGDRVLYYYPPGVPLLAVPLVAAARLGGFSVLAADGRYGYARELALQGWLAALLTAATVAVVLRLARRELPLGPSLAVAAAAALGSSLWSTASRALWTHTFGALLVALALLELLRWDDGARRRPFWLGALVVAGFWVRPTHALVAAAVALYVAFRHRPALVRLLAAGAAGLALFVALALAVWGEPLPPYYAQGGALAGAGLGAALLGLLLSPVRGLLVFSPVLLLVALLLARHGVPRPRRALAAMVGGLLAAQLLLYAAWPEWWGGASYGPRLLTDLVPALAWLGALAWRARRDAGGHGRAGASARRAWAGAALLLALAGGVAHGAGAVSERAFHAVTRTGGGGRARLWEASFNPYSVAARVVGIGGDETAPPRRRGGRRRPPPATAPAP